MARPGIEQTSSSVYYFSQDDSDFVISQMVLNLLQVCG